MVMTPPSNPIGGPNAELVERLNILFDYCRDSEVGLLSRADLDTLADAANALSKAPPSPFLRERVEAEVEWLRDRAERLDRASARTESSRLFVAAAYLESILSETEEAEGSGSEDGRAERAAWITYAGGTCPACLGERDRPRMTGGSRVDFGHERSLCGHAFHKPASPEPRLDEGPVPYVPDVHGSSLEPDSGFSPSPVEAVEAGFMAPPAPYSTPPNQDEKVARLEEALRDFIDVAGCTSARTAMAEPSAIKP